mmetsp:Transcript_19522/g.52604  ORF Transcript_19522/g.52604 Transcript_19522/m.52604 type:complete len:80 (+) Transcript_19522:27-266(+)
MHPLVRDLYKRFIVVSRDYPGGASIVKEKAKKAFFEKAALEDEEEIKRAIARGRYMVKELQGVIALKKYRSMKHRYYSD